MVEVAAGNSIVNVVEAVFTPPKLNTATDAFVVLLYIKAPAAVKFAGLQVTLAKVTKAVLLLASLPTVGDNTLPPAM